MTTIPQSTFFHTLSLALGVFSLQRYNRWGCKKLRKKCIGTFFECTHFLAILRSFFRTGVDFKMEKRNQVSRYWLVLIVAACIEVGWIIGLKHADDVWTWTGTFLAILVSNYLLIRTGRVLPVGTAYAVYVGLGTAGTVIAEIAFFGEPLEMVKIFLILLLLSGVIGLKLITDETKSKGAKI